MAEKLTMLQEIRREEIPNLIKKYQKIVDEIFETVGKPLPSFQNITKDDEIIVTAEMQLYEFLRVRKAALDHADSILIKVNELQRELLDPEYGKAKEEESEDSQKRDLLKERAQKRTNR